MFEILAIYALGFGAAFIFTLICVLSGVVIKENSK